MLRGDTWNGRPGGFCIKTVLSVSVPPPARGCGLLAAVVVAGQVVVVVVSKWVPAHGIGMWCWNMVVVSGSGGWCSSELCHSL